MFLNSKHVGIMQLKDGYKHKEHNISKSVRWSAVPIAERGSGSKGAKGAPLKPITNAGLGLKH